VSNQQQGAPWHRPLWVCTRRAFAASLARPNPDGVYVRRVIPELGTPDYPSPMVMVA